MNVSETVEITGHLIDTGILSRVLDDNLAEGTTADFVVFDRNPLDDLTVLAEPKRIVLRGNLVG